MNAGLIDCACGSKKMVERVSIVCNWLVTLSSSASNRANIAVSASLFKQSEISGCGGCGGEQGGGGDGEVVCEGRGRGEGGLGGGDGGRGGGADIPNPYQHLCAVHKQSNTLVILKKLTLRSNLIHV